MQNYKPLDWNYDLFPEYHKYYTFLKKVYRHKFRKNGFRRISTPLFEDKELIKNSKTSNGFILDNEKFDLRQNPSLWIVRAYLNEELAQKIQPLYFYYMGKFFQKNKDWFEEKKLIWAEVTWEDDPILEAILINMNCSILESIWLKGKFKVKINSTGIEKEKIKFSEELISFYEDKKNILSEKSKDLISENPFLILKSKDEDDMILNENAPKMVPKFLKKHSKEHFNKFTKYLELLSIDYEIDNSLVAENEAQTKSIWNIVYEDWRVISKGARANLIAQNIWEKKEVPSVWFFTDIDTLINLLSENNVKLRDKDNIDLFFVQLWDEAKKVVLPLSIKARESGINTVVSLWTPAMREQMLKAQKSGAKYVVMVWVMEARNNIFQVRNQIEGTQEEVKKDDLIDYIIWKIWKESLDFYSPERDLMI